MKNKHKPVPTSKLQDNTSYLRNTNVEEARKIVEESRSLPHLQKPPKMMLKR